MDDVQTGSVYQIDPQRDLFFGGMFMIVTDYDKEMGYIHGYIPGAQSQSIFIKRPVNELKHVGSAMWCKVHDE